MKRLGLAFALLLTLAPVASAAPTSARSGSARAAVDNGTATLTDGRITRTWKTTGGVVTTSLRRGKAELSNGPSPDFKLELAGVPPTSTSGWTLQSASARREPAD